MKCLPALHACRYGPGLVIYWFGYVADLQGTEPGVLLASDFPDADSIMTLELAQLAGT